MALRLILGMDACIDFDSKGDVFELFNLVSGLRALDPQPYTSHVSKPM